MKAAIPSLLKNVIKKAWPKPSPRCSSAHLPLPAHRKARIIAVLGSYNEERFIGNCLADLHEQGVETILLDNESTDKTVTIAETFLGRGLLDIRVFPREDEFSMENLLWKKQSIMETLDCDWVMHMDPDEIRRSARKGGTLQDWITEVDREGYNAVNFHEFTFVPVRESPDHDHEHYLETMRWYYPFHTDSIRQLKAWKQVGQAVDIHTSGGHQVSFKGLHPCPASGRMRHYLFLSKAQACRKYGNRSFAEHELKRGWHEWRHRLDTDRIQLPSASDLRCFRGDASLNPSHPRHSHIVDDPEFIT